MEEGACDDDHASAESIAQSADNGALSSVRPVSDVHFVPSRGKRQTMKNMKNTSNEGIHAIVLVEYPLSSVVS